MPSVHTQHDAFTSHVSFSQERRQVISRPFSHGCYVVTIPTFKFPAGVHLLRLAVRNTARGTCCMCQCSFVLQKCSLIQQTFINLREMHSLLSAAGGNQDQLSKQPFAAHRHVQIPLKLNLSHFKYFGHPSLKISLSKH